MAIFIKPSPSLMFLMFLFMMVMPTTISSARSFLQPIRKTYLSRFEGDHGGALRTPSGEIVTLLVTKVDDYNVVKGFHLHILSKGIVRGSGPSHRGHHLVLSTADEP
ncbi:hypothetical protein L6452_19980 [Arctium lappa]|uniref:Uncharacterized protein n=1 Tax=Arctium lappa TaxID=4217 RepID=A0ACB9BA54_ARCLA|nr:hypothetical protein L6452_19980 [Arctium lappa]